ncbi:MAG TPA: hypothetical protein VND94_00780 [Terriglobia bacterium]|nr:hypothetical protein [Terriglobia bacterium]
MTKQAAKSWLLSTGWLPHWLHDKWARPGRPRMSLDALIRDHVRAEIARGDLFRGTASINQVRAGGRHV